MKKSVSNYIALATLLLSAVAGACSKDKVPDTITMTTEMNGVIDIFMAGSGSVSIDWGNGSEPYKYSLKNYNDLGDGRDDRFWFSHACTPGTSIRISGSRITHLICGNNQLSAIDVKGNPSLKELACYGNPIRDLDVSHNTALEFLNCKNTLLTSLDLSCNTALYALYCQENNFSAEALQAMFATLHNRTLRGVQKTVLIRDNPGANSFALGTVINGWIIDTML